jgi:hypothetical protein
MIEDANDFSVILFLLTDIATINKGMEMAIKDRLTDVVFQQNKSTC